MFPRADVTKGSERTLGHLRHEISKRFFCLIIVVLFATTGIIAATTHTLELVDELHSRTQTTTHRGI
jgi:hypothetical protein